MGRRRLKIGLIGLGAMGRHYAKNLVKAGFDVTGYARSKESIHRALDAGAKVARSPSEIGESCDYVLLALPGPKEVEEVVLGEKGVLKTARSGTIIIDLGTTGPVICRKVADEAKKKGVSMLDAPVSGGTGGAEAATLTIMVGGEKDVFEKSHKILEALGKNIRYVGKVGSGNVVKLANQMMVGANLVAASEAIVLGKKVGVDAKMIYEIVSKSMGGSTILNYAFPDRVFKKSFQPGFAIKLLHKDLKLATELAREYSAPIPICSNVEQIYSMAEASDLGDLDMSGIVKLMEKWYSVSVEE